MSPEAAAIHYDAIILGSGQGGTPLSKALAEAGWRTALIEREYVVAPASIPAAPRQKRWWVAPALPT
jgi:2-polyprenyl-6-methoxyphenol hydroxylase-like FAD-dependent oxidoreductase